MAIGKLPDDDGDSAEAGVFADINITPLTDVFLVLVVIFMVSALAVQAKAKRETEEIRDQVAADKRAGLKVNLPSGESKELTTEAVTLDVVVPVSGDVEIAGRRVPDADVDKLFQAAALQNKDTQIILHADKSAMHGRVHNLMERARQVGLTKFGFAASSGP